jgi:transcriptional regulator with XRE-family HTH domain
MYDTDSITEVNILSTVVKRHGFNFVYSRESEKGGDMEFGKYLKERRELIGLSQREVAEFLTQFGYPSSAARISLWESGKREPTGLQDPGFMRVLASALEIDLVTLLGAVGYVTPSEDLPTLARQAAEIVVSLGPEYQMIAIRILRVLAQAERESGL